MSAEPGTVVPDGVDIMTGELRAPEDVRLAWEPMNRDQAVEATSRVNAYAKRLPMVVKDVFDGRAWEALGYMSWEDYVDDALVITRRYANMLLAAAVNLELLAEMFDVDVDLFGLPERVLRGIDPGTMVPAITDALAELSGDASDEERVEVIESTVRTERKRTKNTNKEAGGDDGPEPAGDADPVEGGDGASDHDAGQADPEPPAADSGGGGSRPAAPDDGTGQTAPHPVAGETAPSAVSPALELAAEREQIARDIVAARRLLEHDPARVVEVMDPADCEVWAAFYDDMADAAYRFGNAMRDRNQLRSVQ